MSKKILSPLFVLISLATSAQDFGGFSAAVWMYGNGVTNQFYNVYSTSLGGWTAQEHAINGGPGNADWQHASATFTGFDFGQHIAHGNSLTLRGAEVKTYKQASSNACSPRLDYRIYPTGSPTGSYTEVVLPFYQNCNTGVSQFDDFLGPCLDGYQKWQKSDGNTDLTQRNEGIYQMEVYIHLRGNNTGTSGCDEDEYLNNSNNNYIATFTVCPTIAFSSKSNPTTCNGTDGRITLTTNGIADGTYSDRFFYDDEALGKTFDSAVVSNNLATIHNLSQGSYDKIRYYNAATGCSPAYGPPLQTLTDPTPPVASAGADQTICKEDSVSLSATGGGTYLWNTGESTNAIWVAPGDTTVYIVTVTVNNCTDTNSVQVNVNTLPAAQAGQDTAICAGSTAAFTALGAVSYVWDNGQTDALLSVSAAATYTVTVTDENGCTDTDQVTLTVHPNPAANAGNDATICTGGSITLVAIGGDIGARYIWHTADSTDSITITPVDTTTYTVTVTNTSGCTDQDEVTVNVAGELIPGLTPNTSICLGDSITLQANGGVNYSWSTGENIPAFVVKPIATTTYTVTADDGLGICSGTNMLTITIHPNPTAQATGDSICPSETAILTAAGSDSLYVWSTSATGASLLVTPATSTTYTLTITDRNGCTDTAQATVVIYQAVVADAGQDTAICQGDATPLLAAGGSTFSWSTGESTSAIVVTTTITSTYMVTVAEATGCTSTDVVIVTVHQLPTADAGADTAICVGEQVILNAAGGDLYVWSAGCGSQSCPVATAGIYTVTVTDANGCTDTDAVTLTVNPLPTASFFALNPVALIPGEVMFNSDSTKNAMAFYWDFGNGHYDTQANPVHAYDQEGAFTVVLIVASDHACYDTLVRPDYIQMSFPPHVFVPSAFTPNNDGENDVFQVRGHLMSMQLDIYNQWGIKVFTADQPTDAWDGTWKGVVQPEGNYVYLLTCITLSGAQESLQGVVTLIR